MRRSADAQTKQLFGLRKGHPFKLTRFSTGGRFGRENYFTLSIIILRLGCIRVSSKMNRKVDEHKSSGVPREVQWVAGGADRTG